MTRASAQFGSNVIMIPSAGGLVPMQAAPLSGERVSATTSDTAQRLTLPSGTTAVEIAAQEDCYISFGGSGVTVTSTIDSDNGTNHGNRLFLKGVQVVPVPCDSSGDHYTHISVLQVTAAGVFQVEKVG